MEFIDIDDEEEMTLKNEIIILYNKRLDDRIYRKKYLIERGLLLESQKRYRGKEEREIANQLKIFGRFTQTPE